MKIKRLTSLIAVLLLATFAGFAQQAELEPSAEKLQQHVSYLASDALDGRRTGTAGANDAARYLAGEFARLGLQPGTHNNGGSRKLSAELARYLQTFPYVGAVNLGPGNVFSTTGGSFQVGVDWVPLAYSANGKVSGGLVFAGFGLTSSELYYDDYAGLNATGKIAIAFQGTPDGVSLRHCTQLFTERVSARRRKPRSLMSNPGDL